MSDAVEGWVLCVGGAVVDRKLYSLAPVQPETSNPVRGSDALGGVARNVAENLTRLGVEVRLVSRVGDDDAGRRLLLQAQAVGIDCAGVTVTAGATTAQYVALLAPDGELVVAAADMELLESVAPADAVPALAAGPSWVFADCNLSEGMLAWLLADVQARGACLAVDAVSTPKVTRLPARLDGLEVLFCNSAEAAAWLARHGWLPERDDADAAARLRFAGAHHVVLTRGRLPVIVADGDGVRTVPVPAAHPVDVTGAGDALVAGTIAGLARGYGIDDAVRVGARVAALTVTCGSTVSEELTPDLVGPPVDAAG